MWNDKPDGYPIPARNPMGTGMNFYLWVRIRVQISTRSLFTGGRVITLPEPDPLSSLVEKGKEWEKRRGGKMAEWKRSPERDGCFGSRVDLMCC
jgi:hypothetical protein